ncbi:MAG: hypothetical protein F4Y13_06020, partial [Acidimicrobiaceae bacterium]|nr:hypothetical protein [Acidimicrobiaceae bacterium]
AAGKTEADIVVPVKGDVIDEGNETVTVTLGAPTNATVSTAEGAGAASGTITDDDDAPGGIALTASPDSADENGSAVAVTVTAAVAGGTAYAGDRTVTVSVGANGDSATEGVDYDTVNDLTITLNAGQTSASGEFTLTPKQDDLAEGAETVSVTGAAGNGVAVTGDTITINDDEATPTVKMKLAPATIKEAAPGNASTVTATLSGKSSEAVTVTVSLPEGAKAALGGNKVLTIAAGATASTGTVTVTATDNQVAAAADATVKVKGAATGGHGVASPTDATLTIKDDDTAPMSLALTVDADKDTAGPQSSVAEDGGAKTARVTATLAGSTTFDAATEVTVTVGKAGDAATSADYTASPASFTIAIPAGKSSASADFTLTPTDDDLDEDDKALSLEGSAGTLTVSGATITITDDDALPALSIADAAVTEGGQASFTITLNPASGRDVTVKWATAADADGTNPATAGEDYTAVSTARTATIAAGQTKATVTVDTAADKVDEANETFLVNLSSPGNATLASADATATGTITDDDVRGVTVTPASLTLAEADDTDTNDEEHKGAYTVALDSEPTGTVTVSVASGDTGIAAADITSLEFTPSDWDAQTVTVTAVADAADNAGDSRSTMITHTVSAANTDYDGVTAASVTVNVTDDDGEPTLSVDAPSVAEGNSGTATLTFTVTLSPASGKAVTVAYADAATGSATSDTDYAAITAGTLNFAAGDTSKTVEVAVNGDTLDERNETVKLRLSSPANAGFAGDAAAIEATGTITDDDTATLSIDDASAAEGGTASFTVRLSTASDRDVTVTATTSDGAATAPGDYASKTGTVTIAAGATSAAFNVATKTDSETEIDEDFTVTLSDPTGAAISDSTATGTITGNATTLISIADASAREGQDLTFTLTRTGDLSGASTVSWTTGDDTAQGANGATATGDDADYTAVTSPRTVTFAANAGAATITVASLSDALVDGDETFRVNLASPT